jgi:hypothetical protein
MAYTLTLTENQLQTLAWMATRWMAPSKLYESLTAQTEHEDGSITYSISEPDAWEVNEYANDPDDGFTCLNWSSPLGGKIRALLESIV